MAETKRTKAEQRTQTRARLLEVAREEFAEHGYGDAGTNAVVARAQVTRGALYYHFKDKQALFEAVVERESERLAEAVRAAPDTGNAVTNVVAAAAAYLDAFDDAQTRRIALVDAPAALGWTRWREIQDQGAFGALAERFEVMVAAGAGSALEPRLGARMLEASLIEGIHTMAAADSKKREQVTGDVLVIVQALVDGLAGSGASAPQAGTATAQERPQPDHAADPGPAPGAPQPIPAQDRPVEAPRQTRARPSRDRFSQDLAKELARILEDDSNGDGGFENKTPWRQS